MALSPGEMHARIIENLAEKTGHGLSYWLDLLGRTPDDKKSQIAMLKSEHGLGHYTAVAVMREYTNDVPWTQPDVLANDLRQKIDEDVKADYDALIEHARSLPGVEVVPCKTYVGLKDKRQFATIKPNRTSGFFMGLALPASASPDLQQARGMGSARIQSQLSAGVGRQRLLEMLVSAYEENKRS
ncbi:MAG: DUF4287 domain-containing protein [Pseudomonadota bacterium]